MDKKREQLEVLTRRVANNYAVNHPRCTFGQCKDACFRVLRGHGASLQGTLLAIDDSGLNKGNTRRMPRKWSI